MAANFTASDNTSSRRIRATCPDCAAKADGNRRLEHAATCPLGRAIDAISASDRDWFAAHPEATQRVRPMDRAEAEDLRMLGEDPPWCPVRSVTVVTQICPGVRTREFGSLVSLPEDGAA